MLLSCWDGGRCPGVTAEPGRRMLSRHPSESSGGEPPALEAGGLYPHLSRRCGAAGAVAAVSYAALDVKSPFHPPHIRHTPRIGTEAK